MSRNRWTMPGDHEEMGPAAVAVAAVRILWNTEDGILKASGLTVPTDGTAGYAPSCIFHHVDGSAGDMFYQNDGSATSCDFNPFYGITHTGDLIDSIETNDLATAANDSGPSPAIWDDAPVLEVMLDPGKGFHVFEDFLNSLTAAETGGTLATSTAGTFTDLPTAASGIMVLDNAANTADIQTSLAWVNMQCKPGVGTHIYFEVRAKVGVDDGGIFIGLADDSQTDIVNSGAILTNVDHAGFFRDTDTGAAAMGHQTGDGTLVDTADTTIADVNIAAYENFGIHILGDGATAGDYIKFYHKGVLVKNVTTLTKIPDAVMCPTFAIDNIGDTTRMTLSIDWMRVLVYNATSGTARA